MMKTLGDLYQALDHLHREAGEFGLDLEVTLRRPRHDKAERRRVRVEPEAEPVAEPVEEQQGPRPHQFRRSKFNWDSVDWSLSDSDVAEQLGCSNHAVARQRRLRGIPRVDGRGTSPNRFREWHIAPFQAQLMREILTDPAGSVTAEELARRTEQAKPRVYSALNAMRDKGAVLRKGKGRAWSPFRYYPGNWKKFGDLE